MRVLPNTDEDCPPLLLVRTDFRDEAAWLRLRAALDQPWVFDANEANDANDGGW
ncbi:DUF6924 domain-containing protein [Streptomyces sp. MMS24-I2-30]|uniref:DUF6924 domain-containing protein n=1 Tax=Streptomyces sp. MMS24-I2-30 TaxID=3351564 RepID=UPI0038968731